MKKILTLFCLFLTISMYSQRDYRFGVGVGIPFGWMSTDNKLINSNGTNLGFRILTEGEMSLSKNRKYYLTSGIGWSINLGGTLLHERGGELWPETKFSSTVYDSLPNQTDLKYGLQYLEIPIGFKMYTNYFGSYRFYAHLPELIFAFILKGNGAITGPGIPATEKENIRDEVGFMAVMFGIGGGTEISLTDDLGLHAGLRYFRSFNDVTSDKGRNNLGEKVDAKAVLNGLELRFALFF